MKRAFYLFVVVGACARESKRVEPTGTMGSEPTAVPTAPANPPHVISSEARLRSEPSASSASELVRAQERPKGGDPPASTPIPPVSACNEQAPIAELIRTHYAYEPKLPKEEWARRKEVHQASVQYRTLRYGYFRGFGKPEWNSHEPNYYVIDTTFFGVKVRMHERVVPALQCVEDEIKQACSATPYQPKALGGIRMKNTYHTGEVTNHAYGIAIDIDPAKNPCCGCVKPWSDAPICHRVSKTPYDRMSMPECWVHAFTKYGFYWLGHDPMKDTMHFEFLGDPDRILKTPQPPSRP